MRDVLRAHLVAAMRTRDAVAVSALRSALAALDNAEAVPVAGASPTTSAHVAGAAAGIGATEARRRQLTDAEVRAVLQREVAERLDTARQVEYEGQAQYADRLRAEAAVLAQRLDQADPA